ncbi:hypothetical protein [Arthrobacter agilis]|uniref:hypothetical protein n=1 Tax=Arthrobacter agilis TaxID=37921 RepID=UPI0027841160|nr:hypothetical protein [Arthrobacter agilis]MDQ0734458.1 hypothetical protein [Arthrobacter agilis]
MGVSAGGPTGAGGDAGVVGVDGAGGVVGVGGDAGVVGDGGVDVVDVAVGIGAGVGAGVGCSVWSCAVAAVGAVGGDAAGERSPSTVVAISRTLTAKPAPTVTATRRYFCPARFMMSPCSIRTGPDDETMRRFSAKAQSAADLERMPRVLEQGWQHPVARPPWSPADELLRRIA